MTSIGFLVALNDARDGDAIEHLLEVLTISRRHALMGGCALLSKASRRWLAAAGHTIWLQRCSRPPPRLQKLAPSKRNSDSRLSGKLAGRSARLTATTAPEEPSSP